MPATRYAQVRYNVIDRCLRDTSRTYTMDDLAREVTDYFIEELGIDRGVSKSTIEKDIAHMRSTAGFSAPIEVEKTAEGWFYYYTDQKFSISNSPLDTADAKKLKEILSVLEQFRHLPQFSDLEEIILKLESKNIASRKRIIRRAVIFEDNPDTAGIHLIRSLYKHIVNRQVLDITYKPFGKDSRIFRVSPLLLKEYSNRWFLICFLHDKNLIMNLALDRVVTLEKSIDEYEECPEFDHDTYFKHVIGVTVSSVSREPERILLQFKPEQGNYIRTKPLHSSQNIIKDNSKQFLVEYRLIPNYELKRLIWSFGDTVQVLEPEDLMTRAFR